MKELTPEETKKVIGGTVFVDQSQIPTKVPTHIPGKKLRNREDSLEKRDDPL